MKLHSVKSLLSYIAKRFALMIIMIWVGLTLSFIISRLLPFNAADYLVSQLAAAGTQLSAQDLENMRRQLLSLYSLDKPLFVQYLDFLRNYFVGNMGPSFAYFPTPVRDIIINALPWSIVLLMSASIINWIIGNVIGVLAAISKKRNVVAVLENFALVTVPIPYAVLGLAFLIVYALVLKLPLTMYGRPVAVGVSLGYILSMFERALVPLLGLVIVGWTGSFLYMKNLAVRMMQEDFIVYKILQGAKDRHVTGMVFRNALIPQYTGLILGLTRVFAGSMLVEYLFNYPGIGLILRSAISSGDFNLMVGIVSISVIAVAIATFILDLTYPLLDPRIRYPGAG